MLIEPFIDFFFNLLGNSMYDRLKAKILTNSASIDSVTQPDSSLIQLLIP